MAITLSPGEEEKARQAWIAYSTPLWRRAGRSEEWIRQNIETEWASSKQDVMRRYLAGDFAGVEYPYEIPLVSTPEIPIKEIEMAITLLPGEGEKARQDWITYSTPLWKGAGRSEEWIRQNIETEWATSQDDIVRRYRAGDFIEAVARAKKVGLAALPEVLKSPEWWKKWGIWVGVSGIGAILIFVLLKKGKKES